VKHKYFIVVIIWLSMVVVPVLAHAQTSNSTNYQIQESFIGPGGNINSNSTNYGGFGTVGDIGVGESSPPGSGNFRTISGYNTTNDPALSFAVNTSSLNFGALSVSTAATASATFSVYNYTSSGYVVQLIGAPPSSGAHILTGVSPAAASTVGTEQFGINLVANTAPTTFGANPAQVPTSSFSYGAAATNYNTTNLYRYVAGETIATATQSSGQTNFTISYIVNVATSTPGGSYTGAQELVCTGTY